MASEISASPTSVRILSSVFTFEIDYAKLKDLPIGNSIYSPTFTVCGYDWVLEFYPQGFEPKNQGSHVSLYLVLESEAKEDVIAQYSFQLLDKKGNSLINSKDEVDTFVGDGNSWGFPTFISRDKLKYPYSEVDILVICCKIRVLTEPKVVQNYSGGLCEHIEKLWKDSEIFDVTFEVEGESIPAHKFMLAARSTVFAAELFGSMAEAQMERIKINEMKAEVFKSLLHFIYTDKLPVDESYDNGTPPVELLQDLFVAADRYNIGKLSLMCVEQLEKNLSVDKVAETLILADRHSFTGARLKNTCLNFASAPEYFHIVARPN